MTVDKVIAKIIWLTFFLAHPVYKRLVGLSEFSCLVTCKLFNVADQSREGHGF